MRISFLTGSIATALAIYLNTGLVGFTVLILLSFVADFIISRAV